MTTRDDWLSSAISDDRIVAQLLLRLNHASSSSPSASASTSTSTSSPSLLPPPRWGVRHPRSRMAFRCDLSPEKKRDPNRNSPTTPLAWSTGVGVGGSSSSYGTADGCDESTLPVCLSPDSRSKVVVIADEPSSTADANKSKKKKTFAELKEEEDALLKERVLLKKEIATLRTTFKEHTATNENLKRIKLDFDLNSTDGGATTSTDGKKKTASALDGKPVLICRASSTAQGASSFHQTSRHGEEPDSGFLLPDLNMTPSEHDFSLDGLHRAEEVQVMSS
ncbi:hypothetical protein MLD38_014582 [Melastoma candidum]|uniref:Uncharacterized protein n=1 Tax=Melastoma candidum TaxID=119954 RepID=A0ACB9RD78_9MYRT|nr:hypothetical protein MLD38_014582 [Melastoma candidum]